MSARLAMVLLACCVGVLGAAGCGKEKKNAKLPAASARELQTQLTSIESRMQAGACRDVTEGDQTNTSHVSDILGALPGSVDSELRGAVSDSFDRLFALVEDKCASSQTDTETETTPTVTETTPADTETTPTDTETTPTDTTTTPTNTTTTPSGNGKGKGNRGSGGGGTSAPGGGGD